MTIFVELRVGISVTAVREAPRVLVAVQVGVDVNPVNEALTVPVLREVKLIVAPKLLLVTHDPELVDEQRAPT